MALPYRQYSDEQVEDAVGRAVAHAGLPESYRISVKALVYSQDTSWRVCCGGNCRPCIGQVEEAVDHARELLEGMTPALEVSKAPRVSQGKDLGPRREGPGDAGRSPGSSGPAAADPDDPDHNWGKGYA